MQYDFYKNPLFRVYAEVEQGRVRMKTSGVASPIMKRMMAGNFAIFEGEKLFRPRWVVAIVKGCAKEWKSSSIETTRVAIHPIKGEVSHATTSSPRLVAGTRLRRKLSRIFQRLKQESWFGRRPPPAWGTRGKIQSAICQSPRIQRWRRLTSAPC